MIRPVVAVAIALAVSAPAGASDWSRHEMSSRMGDPATLTFYAESRERFSGGEPGNAPMLVIACERGRARFAIGAAVQLQPESTYKVRHVRIRLDDGKPISIAGEENTGGDAVHIGDAAAWIRRLAGAKVALVEVTPYRKGASTVAFPVSGLGEHADELAARCGVKLPPK